MAHNTTEVAASADVVWAVLADPRQYDRFVVGTKRIRRFEPAWPDRCASLHHTVGIGPAVLRDVTTVISAHRPHVLRLHACLRAIAVSEITFTLEETGSAEARVSIEEHPVARLAGRTWSRPFDALLWVRNRELLRRLRRIAEHRATTMGLDRMDPLRETA